MTSDELATAIKKELAAELRCTRKKLLHAIKIGELLIQAKAQVGHGTFQRWVKGNCHLSERSTQRYMLLAKAWSGKSATVADLNMRQAESIASEQSHRRREKEAEERALQQKRQRALKKEAAEGVPDLGNIKIVTGDFREGAKRIADASVDLILTDPVYDNIQQYADLATMALRVLKPGSLVLAFSGHQYIPECIQAMSGAELDGRKLLWMPMICEEHHQAARLWHYQVNINWGPILCYQKRSPRRPARAAINNRLHACKEKQHHPWQKSLGVVEHLVKMLAPPGGLMLDPFCGSGTTAVAAKRTGRRFTGFEVNAGTATLARQRVIGDHEKPVDPWGRRPLFEWPLREAG